MYCGRELKFGEFVFLQAHFELHEWGSWAAPFPQVWGVLYRQISVSDCGDPLHPRGEQSAFPESGRPSRQKPRRDLTRAQTGMILATGMCWAGRAHNAGPETGQVLHPLRLSSATCEVDEHLNPGDQGQPSTLASLCFKISNQINQSINQSINSQPVSHLEMTYFPPGLPSHLRKSSWLCQWSEIILM